MANIQEAIDIATLLCIKFEGVYLKPYACPSGKPTIGAGATFYEDGTQVTLSDPPISRDRAYSLLQYHLGKVFLPAVLNLCPTLARENPGRIAAILDFSFNAGLGRLRSSTLRKRVNAGDWDAVPTELRKWVIGGGRVLPGLVKRREAEIALIG